MKSTVVLRSVAATSVEQAVEEILDRLDWEAVVPKGARVVIKPNLCTERPDQIEVANTDRRLTAAVCRVLKRQTDDITIGESDGIRYPAEAAFENNGIYSLAKELGLKVLNFTREPVRDVGIRGMAGFGLPVAILDCDCFITLPKLKTHATTVFTGALKNQWGCVPRKDRILLHKYLDRLLAEINAVLRPRLALMDAIVAMEGRGPINGTPVRLNAVLGSTDPVALDTIAMRLVGLEPASSRHLVLGQAAQIGAMDSSRIAIDGDFDGMRRSIVPARRDWAIKTLNLVSRSKFLTRHLLIDDRIFYPLRSAVTQLRRLRAHQ